MSDRFLRLAVVFFVIGVVMGIGMAASGNFVLRPAHAHINLLGWASMMLFGLFYRAVPAAAETRLAKLHFWIYVPAVTLLMVLLTMLLLGHTAVEPVMAPVSIAVGVSVLCFAVLVWKHTGKSA